MSADSVVFDMASMSEGSPSIFTKKDWLSILDNQNGSYVGNQCVIDTSQLANSNKYMNYREAYLTVPLYLTMSSAAYVPATTATQTADYTVGLKNWYGSIVHSLTLDMNGSTIIQQTPFCGLWNSFKLMTSLSISEVLTEGPTIGFYPDNAKAVGYLDGFGASGLGTCNNQNAGAFPVVTAVSNSMDNFNEGFLRRQQAWNFNPAATSIIGGAPTGTGAAWNTFISTTSLTTLWKSYITNNVNGAFQAGITAIVYLRHLHSFFDKVPLMKGTFLRLTLNLNQSSVSFSTSALGTYSAVSVNSPLGGVSPIMLASGATSQGAAASLPTGTDYIVSLAVGARVLNTSQTAAAIQQQSPLGSNVILNVPAYTFNPVFESSYLSSPIKKIVYTDIYQYIVNNIAASGTFNNLITNGIANIKSVLCLPFYITGVVGDALGNRGISPIQSPFDPAGGGPTSPLCLLTQFNVQISGQNAIYNTQRYSYEQFANQLFGVNSVNGGLTEGVASGLVSMTDFEMEYNYYYVNVGRMLPVEEAVPKSVSILGQNRSQRTIDIFVFVEYGVEVSVDVLTGARV